MRKQAALFVVKAFGDVQMYDGISYAFGICDRARQLSGGDPNSTPHLFME